MDEYCWIMSSTDIIHRPSTVVSAVMSVADPAVSSVKSVPLIGSQCINDRDYNSYTEQLAHFL